MGSVLNESEIDKYLVGNPQITYFKSVYRRHTPFYKGVYTYAEKSISSGEKYVQELSYGNYDLITNIFLENKITQSSSGSIYANLGNNILNDIKFVVGSQELYKVDGLYIEARAELDNPYVPSSNGSFSVPPILDGTGTITCNTGSQYNVQTMAGGVTGSSGSGVSDIFYTYPNFYFCRDYGSAFPICALNNSEVVLEINYRNYSQIANNISNITTTINIEYVNISDDEKMRFINNTDIYFYYDINEHNYNGDSFRINHPLRQIYFIGNNNTTLGVTKSLSTPTSLSASLTSIDIKVNTEKLYDGLLNSVSIFTKQNLNKLYLGYGRELISSKTKSTGYLDSIGVHSFCLDTTNTPSGHLGANTDLHIILEGDTSNVKVYFEVIKFYKIMGGQLGILFI